MYGLSVLRCYVLLVSSCLYKYVCCRYTDVLDVVQAVICHPDPQVQSKVSLGAVTACIDPLTSFMEHRSFTFFPQRLPVITSICRSTAITLSYQKKICRSFTVLRYTSIEKQHYSIIYHFHLHTEFIQYLNALFP